MVTNCFVKEYKLYGKETASIEQDMKELLNYGYKVTLHYSVDSVGHVLLTAIKEKEEEKPAKTKTTKTTKKDSAAE